MGMAICQVDVGKMGMAICQVDVGKWGGLSVRLTWGKWGGLSVRLSCEWGGLLMWGDSEGIYLVLYSLAAPSLLVVDPKWMILMACSCGEIQMRKS